MDTGLAAFLEAETEVLPAGLAPEISLRLAKDSHAIFERSERLARPHGPHLPPYWAFAWPGGQAMARYILDHPHLAAGKSVLDLGAGSGIVSIAAARAGAHHVVAADIDPLAELAIRANAELNRVSGLIETVTRDLLGETPPADLVIVSDLVYEPELEMRVDALLERLRRAGRLVLMGDRASSARPARRLQELARYAAPLVPPLIDDDREEGRVWRVGPLKVGVTRKGRPEA